MNKKKRWSGKKTAAIIAAVLAGLLLVVALSGYGVFRYYYGMLDSQTSEIDSGWEPEEEPVPEEEPITEEVEDVEEATEDEVEKIEDDMRSNQDKMGLDASLYEVDTFNVMLIGVDSGKDNFSGRSDAMILVSLNRDKKKVLMTSFLRDTYVTIPDRGSNRLNAAYAYGGTDLLVETMKLNFGIRVDRCVVGNFKLVEDGIDALGGLDIALSAEEAVYLKHGESAATYHMNGKEALNYARLRKIGTDFARTNRQREIVRLALEKVKTMSLSQMNELMVQFLPRVRTDLTESDCAMLLLQLPHASEYQMETMAVPAEGTWENARIRGMAVLIIDFQKNMELWYEKVTEE